MFSVGSVRSISGDLDGEMTRVVTFFFDSVGVYVRESVVDSVEVEALFGDSEMIVGTCESVVVSILSSGRSDITGVVESVVDSMDVEVLLFGSSRVAGIVSVGKSLVMSGDSEDVGLVESVVDTTGVEASLGDSENMGISESVVSNGISEIMGSVVDSVTVVTLLDNS